MCWADTFRGGRAELVVYKRVPHRLLGETPVHEARCFGPVHVEHAHAAPIHDSQQLSREPHATQTARSTIALP